MRDEVERLRRDFAAIWGSVEFIAADGAALGGHAFVDTPVARLESGAIVARDGEAGFMRTTIGDARPGLHGVGVMAEASQGTIEVTTDPTAVFPLFYAELPAGVLVSTLLRPLARVLGAAPDPVAIAEYLRFANTFDHRSLFAGIRRLGPGQRLTWSPERGVKISEHSRLWASRLDEIESPEEAAEALQPMLKTALALGLPEHGEHVLMMSAGWDSRSLLAGLAEWFPTADVATFSHGDLRSRELALARKLSEIAGVPWRGRTVGPDVWDPDHLSRSFARTETLVFPHWSWAGVENQECCDGIVGDPG